MKEQRYIWAAMEVWPKLSEERRTGYRALIGEIANTPEEGRALFEVLVRDKTPEMMSMKTAVPVGRIYDMKRAFYDRAEM